MAVKEELKSENDGDILTKKFEYRKIKFFVLIEQIPSKKRFVLLQYLIRDDFTSNCVELFYNIVNEFEITPSFDKGSFLWIYRDLPGTIDISLNEIISSLETIAKEQIDFYFSLKKNIDDHLKEKLKKLKVMIQDYKKSIK